MALAENPHDHTKIENHTRVLLRDLEFRPSDDDIERLPEGFFFSSTITGKESPAKMADAPVTLRTRKFIRNPLLARKQMVV
jgi:hypothetical protein